MSNEEVIYQLNVIACGKKKSEEFDMKALSIAINSIQENTKLKAEIEQLKSELEQSVKLQKTDEESEKERIIIWLNDFCDKFAKCNQCIFNGRCKEFDEMDFDEIKSQYEEAEQSLKGATNGN